MEVEWSLIMHSSERHHGSNYGIVSSLYGLEVTDENEYEMGAQLLDVRRYFVCSHCKISEIGAC